jgi:hypothetical protein
MLASQAHGTGLMINTEFTCCVCVFGKNNDTLIKFNLLAELVLDSDNSRESTQPFFCISGLVMLFVRVHMLNRDFLSRRSCQPFAFSIFNSSLARAEHLNCFLLGLKVHLHESKNLDNFVEWYN